MDLDKALSNLNQEIFDTGCKIVYLGDKLIRHPSFPFMFGKTIYLPSRKWLAEDKVRALAFLAHKLIHIHDRKRDGFTYTINYWTSAESRYMYELRAYTASILVVVMVFGAANEEFINHVIETMERWVYFGMMHGRYIDTWFILNNASESLQRMISISKEGNSKDIIYEGYHTEVYSPALNHVWRALQ